MARPDQAARSVAGWRHALRSTAHGAGAAAAGITAYVCGLTTFALIGALLLAVAPPDLSGLLDSFDKTIAYADGGAPRAEFPDTTGSIAAPDTVRRSGALPDPACGDRRPVPAQADSACDTPPPHTGATAAGAVPPLRGHL
ncbi:MAG: hypothetical protein AB1586_12555 [Pseudomonadota bacterium]